MRGINKIMVLGALGADPKTSPLKNGGQVLRCYLATNEQFTDKTTGEKREITEWHQLAVYNQHLVKLMQTHLKKGSKIYAEGRLATRQWFDEKAGVNRSSTEIHVFSVRFLDVNVDTTPIPTADHAKPNFADGDSIACDEAVYVNSELEESLAQAQQQLELYRKFSKESIRANSDYFADKTNNFNSVF